MRPEARLLPILQVLLRIAPLPPRRRRCRIDSFIYGLRRRRSLFFFHLDHISLSILTTTSTAIITPSIDLLHELLHRRDARGIEILHGLFALRIDGDADPARARVHDERALEQVVQLLGDLDVEARVRVLEHDVLLGLEQGAAVQVPRRLARPRHRVDVAPLQRARPPRRRLPLAAQRRVEVLVREQREEALRPRCRGRLVVVVVVFVRDGVGEGVLRLEDGGLEVWR